MLQCKYLDSILSRISIVLQFFLFREKTPKLWKSLRRMSSPRNHRTILFIIYMYGTRNKLEYNRTSSNFEKLRQKQQKKITICTSKNTDMTGEEEGRRGALALVVLVDLGLPFHEIRAVSSPLVFFVFLGDRHQHLGYGGTTGHRLGKRVGGQEAWISGIGLLRRVDEVVKRIAICLENKRWKYSSVRSLKGPKRITFDTRCSLFNGIP